MWQFAYCKHGISSCGKFCSAISSCFLCYIHNYTHGPEIHNGIPLQHCEHFKSFQIVIFWIFYKLQPCKIDSENWTYFRFYFQRVWSFGNLTELMVQERLFLIITFVAKLTKKEWTSPVPDATMDCNLTLGRSGKSAKFCLDRMSTGMIFSSIMPNRVMVD